jgi:type II secretory pathway component GspD/PulD (secretin)
VGLSITAKPQFSKSYIYVDLNLDISSLLDYDKEKNIANIAKRSLSGTYQLSPNREIKLVGFEQSYKNKKTFKVPILGDLPVLGELFTSNYDDNQKTLLVISFKLIKV